MRSLKHVLGAASALALVLFPALAVAQQPEPNAFGWNPKWRRFDTAEYTLTGVVALSAGALHLFGNPTRDDRVVGPILFDEPVRDALRAHGREDLVRARTAGNVMSAVVLVNALVVDSLVVPIARGSTDVAWQMTWMNAQAYGTSGLVTWILFALVGRARPSYRECQEKTTDEPLCNEGVSAGFPSGHSAGAFTSAGLTCAHHLHGALYGGGLPDALACAASITVATGASTMRLVGDRHYVTDVVAGAAIGFLAGFGLPTLLHYRATAETQTSATRNRPRLGWSLGAERAPLGVSAFGVF